MFVQRDSEEPLLELWPFAVEAANFKVRKTHFRSRAPFFGGWGFLSFFSHLVCGRINFQGIFNFSFEIIFLKETFRDRMRPVKQQLCQVETNLQITFLYLLFIAVIIINLQIKHLICFDKFSLIILKNICYTFWWLSWLQYLMWRKSRPDNIKVGFFSLKWDSG